MRCISSTTSPTVWSRCSDGQQIAPFREQASSATTLSIRLGSQTADALARLDAVARRDRRRAHRRRRASCAIGHAAEAVAHARTPAARARRASAPAHRSCRRASKPSASYCSISSADSRVRIVFMQAATSVRTVSACGANSIEISVEAGAHARDLAAKTVRYSLRRSRAAPSACWRLLPSVHFSGLGVEFRGHEPQPLGAGEVEASSARCVGSSRLG